MFYAFYVVAITILILHFTGWLKRNNLEWVVLVLAVIYVALTMFADLLNAVLDPRLRGA